MDCHFFIILMQKLNPVAVNKTQILHDYCGWNLVQYTSSIHPSNQSPAATLNADHFHMCDLDLEK